MTDELSPDILFKSKAQRAPGWRHVLTMEDLDGLRSAYDGQGNPPPGLNFKPLPPLAVCDASKEKFSRAMAPFIATMKHGEVTRLGIKDIERTLLRCFRRLTEWTSENRSKINTAWLTELDGNWLFIVASNVPTYHEALHESLMDLTEDVREDWLMPVPLKSVLLPPAPLSSEPEGHAPTISFLIDT